MAECRIELRVRATDPLWAVFGSLPGRQRNALARALLEAAVLPGGWARLVESEAGTDFVASTLGAPLAPEPDPAPDPPPSTGMSAAGTQGFLAGLRQFGALTE